MINAEAGDRWGFADVEDQVSARQTAARPDHEVVRRPSRRVEGDTSVAEVAGDLREPSARSGVDGKRRQVVTAGCVRRDAHIGSRGKSVPHSVIVGSDTAWIVGRSRRVRCAD